MRINFMLPGIGIGGGVRVVFEYVNRLSERGHDVTILYPSIPSRMGDSWFAPQARLTQIFGTIKRIITDAEVDWFDLEVPVQRIPTLSPFFIGYFDDLIPDADVTIATAWKTAYTVAALDESKGAKTYFVQHYEIWDTWNSDEAWEQVKSIADDPASYPVEMSEVTPANNRTQREKKLVDRTYELPLAKIAISSWLAELLQSKFDEEVVDVITNSVNHSTFYPDPTTESESLSLLLPYRNAPWKGQREAKQLIDEFATAEIQIHTYGSGNKSELPTHVNHHAAISDEELRHLYSDADIFVLPAWVEGFGLPPLEAMACKCAVVATNVGAVPDYAEDGETASIVPPRDSAALIEAVHELLADDEKRVRLQQQSREHVKSYTWDNTTIQLEQLLQNISEID